MSSELIFIIGFIIFIFLMMAADLGLFAKGDKPVTLTRAAIMSGVWIALALLFYALILKYGDLLQGGKAVYMVQQIAVFQNKGIKQQCQRYPNCAHYSSAD